MRSKLKVAMKACLKAGEIIKRHFRAEFSISSKRNYRDLVTSVDVASEKAIVDVIRASFPAHQILAEEKYKGKIDAHKLWLVDPLDGTTNFVAGLPICCISIAYVQNGKPLVGVVYNPIIDEMFLATLGQGAYQRLGDKLSVTKTRNLRDALVSFDYSSVDEFRQEIKAVTSSLPTKVRGMRILGAAALEFAWVGRGFLDVYLSRGAHSWDVAAGALIVEEAGGKVTDWQGNPWRLDSGNFLATNGLIHEKFLDEVLKEGIK